MPSVLIIDDEPNIRRMVGALLEAEGYDVRDASNGAAGVAAVADDEPDVALIDLMMPGELDGIGTLTKIRERWRELPVIMMSGRASLSDAVRATKLGAVNFLEKPLSPESVLLALSSALELRTSRRVARTLREDLGLTGEMVGKSPPMQQVASIISRVAPTDSRVLIVGESGTGKELVAAAIHEQSNRRDKPFIRVNCAAIPRDLVESEMFGHEKGSFTGATSTRVGRFELAHSGTLFLDEIGDLGIEAQAKLLRAIEAREIQRVGGNKTISVDVRVIAATNIDLNKAVADGTFREDLYFRLNVIPIQLPPLRERGDDIIDLIQHFTQIQYQRASRNRLNWSDEALSLMAKYPWTGNVRELANIVERISIMNAGDVVKASDIAAVLPATTQLSGIPVAVSTENRSLTEALDETEKALISDALARADGSVAEAARILKTDRPNLYRRMKRLGITGLAILFCFIISAGNAIAAEYASDSTSTPSVVSVLSGPAVPPPDSLPEPVPQPAPEPARDSFNIDTIENDNPVFSLARSYYSHSLSFGVTSGKTFNRVEGLPVHLRSSYKFSNKDLLVRGTAALIVRSARGFKTHAPHHGYNNHLTAFFGEHRRVGLGVNWINIISPVETWNISEPENGLATFLLHRDFRDYFQRKGAGGFASWQVNRKALFRLDYSVERWNSIDARDPFTVFRNSADWRPNPMVDAGRFRVLTFSSVIDTRNDASHPSVGWYIRNSYEYGRSGSVTRTSFSNASSPSRTQYGRITSDIRRYNRLSPRNQVNGRLFFGGWIHGDELPLQKRFSIGGPGNLPGYDFRKQIGTHDVFTCGSLSDPPSGMPALCDRVILAQIEFRREIAKKPYDLLNNPAIRIRNAGFTVNPQGVLFVNAGQGWRTSSLTPYPSTIKADFGTGLDFGLLGLYVAKSITDWSERMNFIVRVTRRF